MLLPWPASRAGQRKPDLQSSNWLPAYGFLRVVLSDYHANDLPTRVGSFALDVKSSWHHVYHGWLNRIHDTVVQYGVGSQTIVWRWRAIAIGARLPEPILARTERT